jgi:hypothetical protein
VIVLVKILSDAELSIGQVGKNESHTWTASPNTITGQKVERLIHECPGHLRSHKHVKDWILENWKSK